MQIHVTKKKNLHFLTSKNTEIIDLENSSFRCNKVGAFPVRLHGSTGGLINGKTPFLCGGHYSGDNKKDCYKLTDVGSWSKDQIAQKKTT